MANHSILRTMVYANNAIPTRRIRRLTTHRLYKAFGKNLRAMNEQLNQQFISKDRTEPDEIQKLYWQGQIL